MGNKRLNCEALIDDTLLHRCESQREIIEEIVSFLGEDAIYNEKFARHLIERWDIEQSEIDEFYSY